MDERDLVLSPSALINSSWIECTKSGCERSHLMCVTPATGQGLRDRFTTSKSFFLKSSAVAAPMPALAPVMTRCGIETSLKFN